MCSIRPTDLPVQAERALVTAYEECGSVAESLWLARQSKMPALKSFGGRGGLSLQGVTEPLDTGVALANVWLRLIFFGPKEARGLNVVLALLVKPICVRPGFLEGLSFL